MDFSMFFPVCDICIFATPRRSSIVQQHDLEVESLKAENERLKAELAKKDALMEDLKDSYILAKNTGKDTWDTYARFQVHAYLGLTAAHKFAKTVSRCGDRDLEKYGKEIAEILETMPEAENAIRPTNEYCKYPLPIDFVVDDDF